jgi:hypothetical protein
MRPAQALGAFRYFDGRQRRRALGLFPEAEITAAKERRNHLAVS